MRYFGFSKTLGSFRTLSFGIEPSGKDLFPDLLVAMAAPVSKVNAESVIINMTQPLMIHPYLKHELAQPA